MGSGIIRYIRASKTFSKFRVLRSSVRFEVLCVSKFRVLRSSVRFEVPCASKLSAVTPPNTSSELEMELSLFWMDAGMFLRMDGGWLDALLTYLEIPLGFFIRFVGSVSFQGDIEEVN